MSFLNLQPSSNQTAIWDPASNEFSKNSKIGLALVNWIAWRYSYPVRMTLLCSSCSIRYAHRSCLMAAHSTEIDLKIRTVWSRVCQFKQQKSHWYWEARLSSRFLTRIKTYCMLFGNGCVDLRVAGWIRFKIPAKSFLLVLPPSFINLAMIPTTFLNLIVEWQCFVVCVSFGTDRLLLDDTARILSYSVFQTFGRSSILGLWMEWLNYIIYLVLVFQKH